MSNNKIYIMQNYVIDGVANFVAITEDGYALASISGPPETVVTLPSKLGRHSKWAVNYSGHYPDGYELVYIDLEKDAWLIDRIRAKCAERADERKQQLKLADEIKKHIEIRELSPEEMALAAGSN